MVTANSALYSASMSNDYELAVKLIAEGASLDCPNGPNEMTALHIAAACGHSRIVELLLDSDANDQLYTLGGFTPFYFACQNGHADVCKEFSNSNLDEVYGAYSETVLHVAVSNQHTRIIRLLLDRRANVNVCTTTGSTPLYLASKIGNLEIVKMLVHAGADVNGGNFEEGLTALHIACECEHVHVVEFLLQRGASSNPKFTYSKAVMSVFNRLRLDREEKELLAYQQKRREEQELRCHQLIQRSFKAFF